MMLSTTRLKIEQLRKRRGAKLLEEYEQLDSDQEWLIACYQRALIEKYAEEEIPDTVEDLDVVELTTFPVKSEQSDFTDIVEELKR